MADGQWSTSPWVLKPLLYLVNTKQQNSGTEEGDLDYVSHLLGRCQNEMDRSTWNNANCIDLLCGQDEEPREVSTQLAHSLSHSANELTYSGRSVKSSELYF